MIIHKRIAVKPLANGNSAKKMLEDFYIRNSFENYYNQISQGDKKDKSNREYELYVTGQVIDYIDGVFTLPQLHCIFEASTDELGGWKIGFPSMFDFKNYLIKEYIDKVAKYNPDLDDIENFKKNVSDLNPVIFSLLNDILYESYIFDDGTCDEYKYPIISDDETECLKELKELKWTYDTLERIDCICKKFYHIDDRVAALTSDGYEIKPCWVGTGGVNSTFYKYNKKEIRIQIAASKFKGNG